MGKEGGRVAREARKGGSGVWKKMALLIGTEEGIHMCSECRVSQRPSKGDYIALNACLSTNTAVMTLRDDCL